MKLDVGALRYLSHDDWRTLTAVELGQKNHEIVPTALIESIAKLRHGGTYRSLTLCLKHKLVHHENGRYDGYRLTNLGYDYLAINTLVKRGAIDSVGRQIGVGKESDLFEVASADGKILALKLHRLGRTSFRAVKSKRDYLRKGHHYSWLYLSRLAATKEFAFMKALGQRGLPVPAALEHNRHAVLMSLVDGVPLVQVRHLEDPGPVYDGMMRILSDIVRWGLIHCDFNEFNVMLGPDGALTVIDFPQMVSVSHDNAEELFERDVRCVMRFFRKKLNFDIDDSDRPSWRKLMREVAVDSAIDEELAASGFHRNGADARSVASAHASDCHVHLRDTASLGGPFEACSSRRRSKNGGASRSDDGNHVRPFLSGAEDDPLSGAEDDLLSGAEDRLRSGAEYHSMDDERASSSSMDEGGLLEAPSTLLNDGGRAMDRCGSHRAAMMADVAPRESSAHTGGPAHERSSDDEASPCCDEVSAFGRSQPRATDSVEQCEVSKATATSERREAVHARLVYQQRKAATTARSKAARASRNTSKPRGRRGKSSGPAITWE